ncbi:MAG: helix-turn-helix transcriptional regulator [Lentisphaerae bacterium]|nr:helix-turn-helix transcriptional regulator [Lentisphaerota bacterium]
MKTRSTVVKASADVRARLLDTAVQLFAAQGVAGTTVADIARPVGVTAAMVHYYFKTKDQLLDAVVDEQLNGKYIAFVAGALAQEAE